MTQQAAILADESDDQLVARIAARDHVAMRRAAELYAQIAWRVAYRMLGDASEAEDVAQESLLRLWDHADRWKAGGAGIAPWLKKVTVNQCLDRLRRKRFMSDDEAPEHYFDDNGHCDWCCGAGRVTKRVAAAMRGQQ